MVPSSWWENIIIIIVKSQSLPKLAYYTRNSLVSNNRKKTIPLASAFVAKQLSHSWSPRFFCPRHGTVPPPPLPAAWERTAPAARHAAPSRAAPAARGGGRGRLRRWQSVIPPSKCVALALPLPQPPVTSLAGDRDSRRCFPGLFLAAAAARWRHGSDKSRASLCAARRRRGSAGRGRGGATPRPPRLPRCAVLPPPPGLRGASRPASVPRGPAVREPDLAPLRRTEPPVFVPPPARSLCEAAAPQRSRGRAGGTGHRYGEEPHPGADGADDTLRGPAADGRRGAAAAHGALRERAQLPAQLRAEPALLRRPPRPPGLHHGGGQRRPLLQQDGHRDRRPDGRGQRGKRGASRLRRCSARQSGCSARLGRGWWWYLCVTQVLLAAPGTAGQP